MKVKILATGALEDYEYSYAARLIEQGKAVSAPKTQSPKSELPPRTQKADANAPVYSFKKEKAEKTGKEEVKAGDQ